jgi:hypothetical protein
MFKDDKSKPKPVGSAHRAFKHLLAKRQVFEIFLEVENGVRSAQLEKKRNKHDSTGESEYVLRPR